MSTIFIRAFILYLTMLITLRGMGKHQLGQYQPYEFAMAMLIADLVSGPIAEVGVPLLNGVLPVAALFIIHGIITLLCMRFDGFRAVISGKPALVVSNGVIDRSELDRLCLTLSDLLEGLRSAGILDPKDLGTAVIEANGSISAFPKSQRRPPTAEEMDISTPREGLPLMLIMDGKIQKRNLLTCGQTKEWLYELLNRYNLTLKDVFWASLDTEGMLLVQDKSNALLNIQALPHQEVCW